VIRTGTKKSRRRSWKGGKLYRLAIAIASGSKRYFTARRLILSLQCGEQVEADLKDSGGVDFTSIHRVKLLRLLSRASLFAFGVRMFDGETPAELILVTELNEQN
jgi:hypothetical protein